MDEMYAMLVPHRSRGGDAAGSRVAARGIIMFVSLVVAAVALFTSVLISTAGASTTTVVYRTRLGNNTEGSTLPTSGRFKGRIVAIDGYDVRGDQGEDLCLAVVERNADEGVTWVHSYVSADGKKTFCIYEAPTPEAISKTASQNHLPIDRITQVRVLDPYFYY